MWREVYRTALSFAVIALTLCVAASFTVLPMMKNYRECGTIFLCKYQR